MSILTWIRTLSLYLNNNQTEEHAKEDSNLDNLRITEPQKEFTGSWENVHLQSSPFLLIWPFPENLRRIQHVDKPQPKPKPKRSQV